MPVEGRITFITRFKRTLKKSRLIYQTYNGLHSKSSLEETLSEITLLTPRASIHQGVRLNILVPSVQTEHVFGGIATALKFFEQLADENGVKRRIISLNAPVYAADLGRLSGYQITKPANDTEADCQILSTNDFENNTIPVWKNDIFISTIWWSEYILKEIIKWQAEAYQQDLIRHLFFIQDFEPSFYPWSTRYLTAISTYHEEYPMIAVFNSQQLQEYFHLKGFYFSDEFCFDPIINSRLRSFLDTKIVYQKKKQIIIYGRPNTPRNAIEMIIEALRLWAAQVPDSAEWTLLSVGEKHQDVQVGGGCALRSLGKLSLEKYAKLMMESHAGISLMVSPHPSYPPLEMSTFGVKTITNRFANKDLSNFNNNIISLRNCTAQSIASELVQLCERYDDIGVPGVNPAYLRDAEDEFAGIINEIGSLLIADRLGGSS